MAQGTDEADDQVDEDEEDENSGELVYELAEWLPEQRVELSMLLESAGIAYNWDGPDLTVAEDYETEVDGLFEQVHGLLDDDDEARYRSIEELFGAVDRLANDPGNDERRAAFLGAVAAVELPTPVGVDDAYWWRVRSQGHVVVGALDNGAAQRGRLARVGSPGRDAPRNGLNAWTATACCSPQGRAQVATNPLS